MRYSLDPSESRFTVQAFARGALSAFGHSPTFLVREFSGEFIFTPENDGSVVSSLQVIVKANSLTLVDQVSPKDRAEIETTMQREVLETSAYPEISYRSAEIRSDKIVEN
jgi:polyisoprenoid-binding protein YceI